MSVEEQVKLSNFSSIFSLEGKVAVVTGGSRGLGLHAASGYVSLCANYFLKIYAHISADFSKLVAPKSTSPPARR
jgi:hypothetical protein